jgi:hypothetical protein
MLNESVFDLIGLQREWTPKEQDRGEERAMNDGVQGNGFS